MTAEKRSSLFSERASNARPTPTLKSPSESSGDSKRYFVSFSHFPVTQDDSVANGSDSVLLASDC